MTRRFGWLAIGAICLSMVGEAQEKLAQSPPTFHAAVELVQLDVTVLDKDHRPVQGLAQSDFTILEDGKPQKPLSFASFDAAAGLGANVAKAPVSAIANVGPDVVSNELPAGRLFVLLFDDALIPFEPKMIADAKKIGTEVVSHLDSADRMAVVFTAANRSSQDFTNDRTRLQTAVDSLNPRNASWFLGYDMPQANSLNKSAPSRAGVPATPNLDADGQFYAASLQTLGSVIDYLADSPERRKVLIYVSPGVPINYELLSPVLAHGTGTGMPNLELHRGLAQGLPDLFRRAQRANVAVYAVDPTGLDGLAPYLVNRLMSLQGMKAPAAQEIAHKNATLAMDTLNTAAANTGGRAIINTNDFAPGIAAMFEESRSYYLLAYAATDPGSGNMHRLEVKVNRPEVEVLTRHGYYASDAKASAKNAAGRAVSPLSSAISSMLPNSGLSMRASVTPFADTNPLGAAAAIVLNLSVPPPQDPSAPSTDTIDVQVSAFTAEGTPVTSKQQSVQLKLKAGTTPIQFELLSRIDLKPGRYELRIAANSHAANAVGSVFVDVDVPDFTKSPITMSDVLFDANPRVGFAGKEALTSLLPIMPTAERVFARTDHVTAFVRIYQSALASLQNVVIGSRILNGEGTPQSERRDYINAASFDPDRRSADERISLPLDRLAPGDYVLIIGADVGPKEANRTVRFMVR